MPSANLDSSNLADTEQAEHALSVEIRKQGISRQRGLRRRPFLKFLAREWTSHIIWTLAREDVMRFGALRRSLPGAVSARVLSSRLKELESYGLVSRYDAGKLPLHIEYRLTAEGRRVDVALRRGETFTTGLRKSTRGDA